MQTTEVKIREEHRQLQRDLSADLPERSFELIDTLASRDATRASRHRNCLLAIIISVDETPNHWLGLVRTLRCQNEDIKIVLIVRRSSETQAVAALKAGVDDYYSWPVDYGGLIAAINRLQAPLKRRPVASKYDDADEEHAIVGESAAIRKIRDYLPKVALSESTVLITGDTGTGKECVARQIYRFGRRCDKPLVSINCAALPDGLLESELFGYQRGAFTGANRSYQGKLKLADGGTVFFDEIGDLSLSAQAKVLRLFENKEITPLHGATSSSVDVRIVAATNRDLRDLVRQKQFREDLYYRLNVARVHLPPLRERKEDIGLLLEHFLHRYARRFDKPLRGFSAEAFECLMRYDWPGNIRELRNLVESLFIDPQSSEITSQDLPPILCDGIDRGTAKDRNERKRLLTALSASNWNKTEAARQLNWSRMKVYRKMARYQIHNSHSGLPGR